MSKRSKELETTCPHPGDDHPYEHPPHYKPLPLLSGKGRDILRGGSDRALDHLRRKREAFSRLTIAERRAYIEGLGLTYTPKERKWTWYYSDSARGEAETKDAALRDLGTEVMRYTGIPLEDCIAAAFGDTIYYYLPAEVDSASRYTWNITRHEVEEGEK